MNQKQTDRNKKDLQVLDNEIAQCMLKLDTCELTQDVESTNRKELDHLHYLQSLMLEELGEI